MNGKDFISSFLQVSSRNYYPPMEDEEIEFLQEIWDSEIKVAMKHAMEVAFQQLDLDARQRAGSYIAQGLGEVEILPYDASTHGVVWFTGRRYNEVNGERVVVEKYQALQAENGTKCLVPNPSWEYATLREAVIDKSKSDELRSLQEMHIRNQIHPE